MGLLRLDARHHMEGSREGELVRPPNPQRSLDAPPDTAESVCVNVEAEATCTDRPIFDDELRHPGVFLPSCVPRLTGAVSSRAAAAVSSSEYENASLDSNVWEAVHMIELNSAVPGTSLVCTVAANNRASVVGVLALQTRLGCSLGPTTLKKEKRSVNSIDTARQAVRSASHARTRTVTRSCACAC